MRKRRKNSYIISSLILIFCLWNYSIYTEADIMVGTDRSKVVTILGKPQGRALRDGKEVLYYPEAVIAIKNGKVAYIEKNPTTGKSGSAQTKKKKRAISSVNEPPVKVYKEGGREIDLRTVIVPGQITIVDFYADWCGPCRQISPQLERLAKSDPNVFLRKIDIVNWNTPVVKQYNISGVPNIRVFDRSGNMVGSPVHSFQAVTQYIERAK